MKQSTKKQIITIVILLVMVGSSSIGVIIYAFPAEDQVQTDWRALLVIRTFGEQYPIPAGIGVTNQTREKVFTINSDGLIFKKGTEDATLGEFFRIWGESFNSSCVLEYCNNANSSMRLYINNKENFEYENYIIKNRDVIIIDYR